MNFQKIPPVGSADDLIDLAFRRAKKKTEVKRARKEFIERLKDQNLSRVDVIQNVLEARLQKILESFPVIEDLASFYLKLIKINLEYVRFKKSLGAVNWLRNQIRKQARISKQKIKRAGTTQEVEQHRRSFYGRVNSFTQQIKKELLYLDEARKVLKDFPAIKTSTTTVALFGFPNVGKTTLLMKLTGSKAEIASYAFTTRGINVNYIKKEKSKLQLADTPGTLNRLNKMNPIEQQAWLVIQEVADAAVYVFDLTEEYPLEHQLKLYARLKKEVKTVFVYFSKKDLVKKQEIEAFAKKNKLKKYFTSAKELKTELISRML